MCEYGPGTRWYFFKTGIFRFFFVYTPTGRERSVCVYLKKKKNPYAQFLLCSTAHVASIETIVSFLQLFLEEL